MTAADAAVNLRTPCDVTSCTKPRRRHRRRRADGSVYWFEERLCWAHDRMLRTNGWIDAEDEDES